MVRIERSALRRGLIALLIGAAVAGGSARAQGLEDGEGGRSYRTVIVYETVKVPQVRYVMKYGHCGRACRVRQVTYRAVRVPVEVRVPIPEREPSGEPPRAADIDFVSR